MIYGWYIADLINLFSGFIFSWLLASIMPQHKLINRWLAWLEKLHKIRPNKEVIARYQGEALAKWLYQQRLAAMTEQS